LHNSLFPLAGTKGKLGKTVDGAVLSEKVIKDFAEQKYAAADVLAFV